MGYLGHFGVWGVMTLKDIFYNPPPLHTEALHLATQVQLYARLCFAPRQ